LGSRRLWEQLGSERMTPTSVRTSPVFYEDVPTKNLWLGTMHLTNAKELPFAPSNNAFNIYLIDETRTRCNYFWFGWVFIKKIIKLKFYFLKKNRTETGSNRPVSVRSGPVFRAKTGSNRFDSVFPVLARFSQFGSVFFLVFCRFRFGFLFIKPKPNQPVFSKF
jgi:hypothetical protein